MSDITRPNRPVPTTARRTAPPPAPSTAFAAGMPPVAPPPPGVSQTIVIVHAPPAAAVPEPKKQVEFIPVRRKPARQLGFLAVVSIILGGVGALAAFRPEVVGWAPVIAATGFFAAIIALFKSTFMTRTTFRAPMLGMMVSFAAYVIAIAFNHKLQSQYNRLRSSTGDHLPLLSLTRFERDPAPVAAVNPTPTNPARPSMPAGPAVVAAPVHATETARNYPSSLPGQTTTPPQPAPKKEGLSWLDPNSGGWIKPGEDKPAVPAAPGTTSPPPAPVAPAIDLVTAEQHLAAARASAAIRLNVDYAGAQSAVASASAAYDTAGKTYSPGSPELASASQTKLDAKTNLARVQSQLDTDPAVAAAQREVRAAVGRK